MNLWNETKSVPVSREMVWAAYKKVKANKGSAGIDEISMEEFDADRSRHLYKLWNRMVEELFFNPENHPRLRGQKQYPVNLIRKNIKGSP